MPESAVSDRAVPFGPWKTFKSFIETDLKAKTVPDSIDSSLFRGKSGTDSRQLRSALRYHRLVEGDNDQTTDRLRALVAAFGSEGWKASVAELLRSYDGVLRGVDLTNGTQKQLEDAFRERGDVTGSTLKKAVRLYLAMATEAGMKLSPHFISVRGVGEKSAEPNGASSPAASSNTLKPKRKRPSRPVTQFSSEDDPPPPPNGVDALQPLPDCDFRVWIPRDMTKAQLDFAMKYLKDWLKLKRADLE